MDERIVTPRLVLSPIAADVARAILAGDLSAVRAGDGWPHADTLDGLRIVPGWFVELDGVVIGDCGTHGPPRRRLDGAARERRRRPAGAGSGPPSEAGEVVIGYGLAAPYRGRGFGTELVAGLSAHLLARAEVCRVVAQTEADNVPSRRALERAGFVADGSDRGLIRYVFGG